MALDRKWLHAQFNLAWKLVVHYVRKLWPWAPRFGLVRFQENYVPEGLPPATAAFRALAHWPGRCTGCGVCDDVCPVLAGATDVAARDFMGPHALVVAGARGAPHLVDVAATLAVFTGPVCAACKACDRACPERIPITELAAALHAQAAVVEDAKRGSLPVLPSDVPRLSAAAAERHASQAAQRRQALLSSPQTGAR